MLITDQLLLILWNYQVLYCPIQIRCCLVALIRALEKVLDCVVGGVTARYLLILKSGKPLYHELFEMMIKFLIKRRTLLDNF